MHQIGIGELHQMLIDARRVADYAQEYCEQLFGSREHTYTLYGPAAYYLGVSIPSQLTPDRARALRKKTRREKYIAYELDSEYKILRTVHIRDHTKAACIFHHFEIDGISYAFPFHGDTFDFPNSDICIMEFANEKPLYYAVASDQLLFVQFYEYISGDKMIVSTYRYWPTAPFTMHGYPVDREAPIGALNSPVQYHCTEEVPHVADFSQWFR